MAAPVQPNPNPNPAPSPKVETKKTNQSKFEELIPPEKRESMLKAFEEVCPGEDIEAYMRKFEANFIVDESMKKIGEKVGKGCPACGMG